ncbi:MAG: DNA double-strand break repair nuclease NurA [Tissierellaceae bacterium]|nr:DNA double-strand break repair nuclease NurA [Tissierellaceae bacterium]
MQNLNSILKDKVLDLNSILTEKYDNILKLSRDEFRVFINTHVGEIKKMSKLDNAQLSKYQSQGGIVGVDGSVNKLGGAYPHFVEIYQALAKSTTHKDDSVVLADIYSPLNPEQGESIFEDGDEIIDNNRNIKLSTLEVDAAIESVIRHKPYAILMDGGLIRYNINAHDRWMELRNLCEQEGVILVGVIKDIKTSIIGDKIKEVDKSIKDTFYDREVLFGHLDYGEMILINEEANKKEPKGYASVFLRSSLAPSVIGMDIIDSQREHIEEMARLLFTLTPENSRGVPLWLDIVDKEVLISDDLMRSMMEQYMDRGLYERFFVSERDKRN